MILFFLRGNVGLTVVKMHLGPSKRCRIIRVVGLTVVKCRINRGKIHGIYWSLAGPKINCRIIRVVVSTVVGLTVLHCIYHIYIEKT